MLIVALFALCSCFVSTFASISRGLLRHSNELEQYLRYEQIVTEFNESSSMLSEWLDCVNLISQNFKNAACSEKLNQKCMSNLKSNSISQFVRVPNPTRVRRYLPDCTYDVNLDEITRENILDPTNANNGKYFQFTINQKSCNSSSILLDTIKGGASFTIHASNVYHLVSCSVRDTFDGSYEVLCSLPRVPSINGREFHRVHSSGMADCFYLTISLDFEHFDAFSEAYGYYLPIDYHIVNNQKICFSHYASSKKMIPMVVLPSNPTLKQLKEYYAHDLKLDISDQVEFYRKTPTSTWSRRLLHSHVDEMSSSVNFHTLRERKESHYHEEICAQEPFGLFDYAWTGSGATFPTVEDFKSYFENRSLQSTEMWGESHMRYNWDLFYSMYYGTEQVSKLYRKHGIATNIPGLSLSSVLFATDLGDILMGTKCPTHSSSTPRTLVVQIGSWDLGAVPLRYLIRHPGAFPHLLKGLESLIQQNCSSDSFRLIYVSTMTPVYCTGEPGNQGCLNSQYRTLSAVKAANQWMQGHLILLQSKFIHWIDTVGIVEPRWRISSTFCNNHYLCHPYGPVMQFSANGLSVAGEILQCAMWKQAKHQESINCMSMKELSMPPELLLNLYRERTLWNSHSHANLQIVNHIDDKSSSYLRSWLVEGNLRREIPDDTTREMLKSHSFYHHNNDHQHQSHAASHPIIATASSRYHLGYSIDSKNTTDFDGDIACYGLLGRTLPSRRNNNYYTTLLSSQQVFAINNGTWYPLPRNESLLDSKPQQIEEDDMFNIAPTIPGTSLMSSTSSSDSLGYSCGQHPLL